VFGWLFWFVYNHLFLDRVSLPPLKHFLEQMSVGDVDMEEESGAAEIWRR